MRAFLALARMWNYSKLNGLIRALSFCLLLAQSGSQFAAIGLVSSVQPALCMPRKRHKGASGSHTSFCSRTAPVARRSRPLSSISRNPNNALPDAVEAAAFQAHRSQTVVDERKNPRHHSQQLKSCSYNTHLSATAVPTLRVGRPGLVSGGNRASGPAPGFCRRGARGFRFGSGGG